MDPVTGIIKVILAICGIIFFGGLLIGNDNN